AVTELRQHESQCVQPESELMACATQHSIGYGVEGFRMPAEGIGPRSGPCLLVQCPPSEQKAPPIVHPTAGEGHMQRRVLVVHFVLASGTTRPSVLIEQHDPLRCFGHDRLPKSLTRLTTSLVSIN